MARDYAKQTTVSSSRKPSKTKKIIRGIFLVALLCSLLGVSLKIMPLLKEKKEISSLLSDLKLVISQKKSMAIPVEKHPLKTQNFSEIHFDFYNELPAAQMDVKPEMVSEQYYLIFANVSRLTDAKQLQVSLLLAGVEGSIVKNKTLFQVQQGPYTTIIAAKAMQQKLSLKGIGCEVKKG